MQPASPARSASHGVDDTDPSHDLVYGPNDRPAPMVAFVAALQHLLAIIVPIVTPGLLICQALGVSSRDTTLIVSMSLVISGIATFVQCKRFGPLGAGLLIVQGTSFNFVGPLIAGGSVMVKQGTPVETVMAAIFGVVIDGSFVEISVSRILPFVKRLITPLVTGIVVLLIGLTLIKVGLISMGGGYGAMANGTFASAQNLTLSCLVLGTIILLNRVPIVWVRSTALVIALVIGYIAAAVLGRLDFTGVHQAALFQVPTPLHFGIGFSWALFIPMLIIYLVTSLEAIGDVTATSKISKEPVEGPVWMQRIKGGVLVNGANSLLAGVPLVTQAQHTATPQTGNSAATGAANTPQQKPTVPLQGALPTPVTTADATGAAAEDPRLMLSVYRNRRPYAQSNSALLRRTIRVLVGAIMNPAVHTPVNSGAI